MAQKKALIVIAIIAIAVIVGAYILYNQLGDLVTVDQLATTPKQTEGTESDASAEPVKAPDFTVYDYQGNTYKLSDFVGKPVILNFWASWCGPCKSEMPAFQQAYEQYGADIHFLIVNMTDGVQETVLSATSFIEELGYQFPVYYDSDLDAAMQYGVSSIPATYIIDEYGYIVAWANGALSMESLSLGIEMVIEKGE